MLLVLAAVVSIVLPGQSPAAVASKIAARCSHVLVLEPNRVVCESSTYKTTFILIDVPGGTKVQADDELQTPDMLELRQQWLTGLGSGRATP